nr:MAG TPA: hypothetical protein [Caudoviricetes sp.]
MMESHSSQQIIRQEKVERHQQAIHVKGRLQ